MLPNIALTPAPGKPTADSEIAQPARSLADASLSEASAESGPSAIRAETSKAVDPAEQAARTEPLRNSSTDGQDLSDTIPAGPPPAFVETLLERQAREAFQPDETAPAEREELSTKQTQGDIEKAVAVFADAKTITENSPPNAMDVRS